MPLLLAVFLSWQALIKSATTPPRQTPQGHIYVRGEKARVEQGDTVAIWDGRRLRVRTGTHEPLTMDASLRPAFGIPPSCLEQCGFHQVGTDTIAGTPVRVFEKLFAKTPMGPLKQALWVPEKGPPLRLETRSARGITRMDLEIVRSPPPAEKLFRFAK